MKIFKNGVWQEEDKISQVEIDATLTQEGKAADAKAVGDALSGAGNGTVRSVNGVMPDGNGNVTIDVGSDGTVQSVNGMLPDGNGNVQITIPDPTDAEDLANALLRTTAISVDWSAGSYIETLSDGSSRVKTIVKDANGVPTKIGDVTLTLSGVV